MAITEQQILDKISAILSFKVKAILDYNNPILENGEFGVHFPTGTLFFRNPDTGSIIKPNEVSADITALVSNKYDYVKNLLTADIIGNLRYYHEVTDFVTNGTDVSAQIYDGMTEDKSTLVFIVNSGNDIYSLLPNTFGGMVTVFRMGPNLYYTFNDTKGGHHISTYVRSTNTKAAWNDLSRVSTHHNDLYELSLQSVISTTSGAKVGKGSNVDISTTIDEGPFLSFKAETVGEDIETPVVYIKDSIGDIRHTIQLPYTIHHVGTTSDIWNMVAGTIERKIFATPVGSPDVETLSVNKVYKILSNVPVDISQCMVNEISATTTEANKNNVIAQNKIFKGADGGLYLVLEKSVVLTLPVWGKYILPTGQEYETVVSSRCPSFKKDDTISFKNSYQVKDITVDGAGSAKVIPDGSSLIITGIVEVNTTANSTRSEFNVSNYTISADKKSIEGLTAGELINVIVEVGGKANPAMKVTYDIPRYSSGFMRHIFRYLNTVHESSQQTPLYIRDILKSLKDIDGHLSGLDADTVDGIEGADIIQKTHFLENLAQGSDGQNKISVSTRDLLINSKRAMVGYSTADGDILHINFDTDFANGIVTRGFLQHTGNMKIDNGESSKLTILSDDSGESLLELIGASQGTGRIFVGQSASHGGGFLYNGDGTPTVLDADFADDVVFYRRDNNVNSWVFRYNYGSSNVIFRGELTANGDKKVWHEGNDGADSGLDADLIHGVSGASYVRKDIINTFTQDQILDGRNLIIRRPDDPDGWERALTFTNSDNSAVYGRVGAKGDNTTFEYLYMTNGDYNASGLRVYADGEVKVVRAGQLGRVLSTLDADPTQLMTLNTSQTITGAKQFNVGITAPYLKFVASEGQANIQWTDDNTVANTAMGGATGYGGMMSVFADESTDKSVIKVGAMYAQKAVKIDDWVIEKNELDGALDISRIS